MMGTSEAWLISIGVWLLLFVVIPNLLDYFGKNKENSDNSSNNSFPLKSISPQKTSGIKGYSKSNPKCIPSSMIVNTISVHHFKLTNQDVKLKEDWYSIASIIDLYEITCLFHFTDAANLPSIIKNGGLFSREACLKNGISIPRPGGNHLSRELDNRQNLNDFIHLSFNPEHPMQYVAQREGRISNPKLIKISTDVIFWDTTLYSDENAASYNSHIGGSLEDFRRLDLVIACGKGWSNETEKRHFQAEVLVKKHIPLVYLEF